MCPVYFVTIVSGLYPLYPPLEKGGLIREDRCVRPWPLFGQTRWSAPTASGNHYSKYRGKASNYNWRAFTNHFSTPCIPHAWGILELGGTPKPLAEGTHPSALPR